MSTPIFSLGHCFYVCMIANIKNCTSKFRLSGRNDIVNKKIPSSGIFSLDVRYLQVFIGQLYKAVG